MFNWLKKDKDNKPLKSQKNKNLVRNFIGARASRMNHFNTTFARINEQLRTDYIALTLRARELYKNNETVKSYVDLMIRSVFGSTGFILNCTAYNEDGTSDIVANDIIENHWYNYMTSIKKYVCANHQLTGLDFDKQILFNLLIDGEVFIRKIKDPKSKYGIRFQLIDSLDIDVLYNVEYLQDGTKIVMGIKVDQHYKPISYFMRKSNSANYYLTGERVEIPADEIIHIYRQQFCNQCRGFTPLSSVLLTLNSIEEYKHAEVSAAILNSAFMGIWIQNSGNNAIDEYDQSEVDQQGDIATELQGNVFRFAPKNHTLQQIQSQHPNSNIKQFLKCLLKGISAALGMSYNKINSDVSQTSYSSLRQANIEDQLTVKQLQTFLIENWKNIQYAEWLKYLLLSDLTNLPYSKIDKFMIHDFQGRNFQYLSPKEQLAAIQIRLSLGLSSPIEEIHNLGKSPQDVLNSWAKYLQMLKDRGLKMADTIPMLENIYTASNVDEQTNKNEE